MVVMILVLSVFITAPSGTPKSLKRCKKKCTSYMGMRQLVSSTYAIIMGAPPCPSSCGWLFRRRSFARSRSSWLICLRMCVKTSPANRGERGHP